MRGQYIGLHQPSIINADDALPNYCMSFWSAYLLFKYALEFESNRNGTAGKAYICFVCEDFLVEMMNRYVTDDHIIKKSYIKFNLDKILRIWFNIYANVEHGVWIRTA